MEGYSAKELVSADSNRINLWDLKTSSLKSSFEPKLYYQSPGLQEEDSLNECTVVKRDPHHKNLLCVGIEKGFF